MPPAPHPARRTSPAAVNQRPPRRSQERRRADSEEAILCAAERLFAVQGYLRTTLSQVGDAAGYTGGLVSHRFGSKEGLLKVVLARLTAAQVALGSAVSPESTTYRSRINALIDAHLTAIIRGDQSSLAFHVISGEAAAAVPEARDALRMLNHLVLDQFARAIARGSEQGEFAADVDANAMARMILGTLRGSAAAYLAAPHHTDLTAMGDALKRVLGQGLR